MVIIIIVIVNIIICYHLIIGCMFVAVRYFDFRRVGWKRKLVFRLMTKHPEDTGESNTKHNEVNDGQCTCGIGKILCQRRFADTLYCADHVINSIQDPLSWLSNLSNYLSKWSIMVRLMTAKDGIDEDPPCNMKGEISYHGVQLNYKLWSGFKDCLNEHSKLNVSEYIFSFFIADPVDFTLI